MTIEFLKDQATRLADHLADKHGVKLKHGSALEAIASVHGARDWNTLRAGVIQRDNVQDKSAQYVNAPHTLVFGTQEMGAAVLLEQMAVAHVAQGGGLLYFSPQPDQNLDDVLRHAAEGATHKPQFLSLAPPDPEGVQTCLPRLEALAQSGYVMHVAPVPGESVSAAHAGTSLLLRQLNAVLSGQSDGARALVTKPLMVVVPAARFDLCWLSLLRQGRFLGITFVIQADSPVDLDRIGLEFLNAVLGNVGTQLMLMPANNLALARTVSHVTIMATASHQRVKQILESMRPGEALRMRDGVLELIRYDGLFDETTVVGRTL